jgi:hypothetical protein
MLDSARVEAFFDRAWAETLRDGGAMPGAVITVVQDRTVVLNKGYGVTDIATANVTPINAASFWGERRIGACPIPPMIQEVEPMRTRVRP